MSAQHKRDPLGQRLIRSLEEGLKALRENKPLAVTIVPQPPAATPYNREQIIGLRQRLKWSQSSMARWLNVSYKTVQSWEQGTRKPSGASLRLLQLLEHPSILEQVIPENSRAESKKRRTIVD